MKVGDWVREWVLAAAGLVLGTVNTVRHNRYGYTSPRPFRPDDLDLTATHAIKVVDRLQECANITWEGKDVLELGPGPDLTTGLVLLDRGVASYQAVDMFDNRWQAPAELYTYLAQKLGTRRDESELLFTQTSFPSLPDLVGTFDVVISNACLEHVAEVGPLFARLMELTRPGGSMIHHIDGKAHMRWFRDHDPLNHLRYTDALYRRLLSFPGAPNRLRASDFRSLAERAGWRSAVMPWRSDSVAAKRTRVAKRFQGYPDLDVMTFTLVASRE